MYNAMVSTQLAGLFISLSASIFLSKGFLKIPAYKMVDNMVEKNTTIQNMFSTVFALSMNKSLNGCNRNTVYIIFIMWNSNSGLDT